MSPSEKLEGVSQLKTEFKLVVPIMPQAEKIVWIEKTALIDVITIIANINSVVFWVVL